VIRSSSSKRAWGSIWSYRHQQFCDWLQPIFVSWLSRLFTLGIRGSYKGFVSKADLSGEALSSLVS
jgi:hypothetical protein